jgi:hypothetical protein
LNIKYPVVKIGISLHVKVGRNNINKNVPYKVGRIIKKLSNESVLELKDIKFSP